MKIIAFLSIVFGEVLIIYSEVLAAKLYTSNVSFSSTLTQTIPAGIVGAILLVIGYALGLKAFQNIWIVSAISIGSLLIVEPMFNYFYIGHTPTLGSGIGFALGVLGILASLFL